MIPTRFPRGTEDVRAVQRRERNRHGAREPDARREPAERRLDLAKARLGPSDKVHLVHREPDMAHASRRGDVAVPARLRAHSIARIHEEHGSVRARSAGRHVARVLLVAGRVGDEEATPRGGKRAPGHVNGDALLALGGEPIQRKREIERFAARAVAARVLGECGKPVLRQQVLACAGAVVTFDIRQGRGGGNAAQK